MYNQFINPRPQRSMNSTDMYVRELRKLETLALNRYRFEGLKNKLLDLNVAEVYAYRFGYGAVMMHDTFGLIVLKATPTSISTNETPRQFLISSYNGAIMEQIDLDDPETQQYVYIVRNNFMGMPDFFDVDLYAQELTNIRISIFQKNRLTRTPYIIRANRKMKAKILYEIAQQDSLLPIVEDMNVDIQSNENAIAVDELKQNYDVSGLRKEYIETFNDAIQSLGYLTTSIRKATERLTEQEAQSGIDIITANESESYKNRLGLLDFLKVWDSPHVKLIKNTYAYSIRDIDFIENDKVIERQRDDDDNNSTN
jgi:hypothetical protein